MSTSVNGSLSSLTVAPEDRQGIERMARYLLRAPVSLERLRVEPQIRSVHYRPKNAPTGGGEKTFEVTEFLARLLQHVPEPAMPMETFDDFGGYDDFGGDW